MNQDYHYFGQRTNYLHKRVDGKSAIIYDDHRCILNVIYFGLQNGLIKEPPNVIYFDKHDDGCVPRGKTKYRKFKKFRTLKPDIREFWDFVEFEMAPNDDDWVLTGMELGIINHAVVIGSSDDHNNNLPSHYTFEDQTGQSHYFIGIPHLHDCLDGRGCLGDSHLKEPYFKLVREIFQFNNGNLNETFDEPANSFVLDFDLDCFTYDQLGTTKAWPKKKFEEFFYKSRNPNWSGYTFVKALIDRCRVITICREPDYCGGFTQSQKILKRLFDVVFRAQLE